MTATRRTKSGKGQGKKLKLKKETIKNLEVRGKASKVKGGMRGTVTLWPVFTC